MKKYQIIYCGTSEKRVSRRKRRCAWRDPETKERCITILLPGKTSRYCFAHQAAGIFLEEKKKAKAKARALRKAWKIRKEKELAKSKRKRSAKRWRKDGE